MNRKSIAAILIIVVMMLCASANAFDGERKGFAMGFGMGMSPYVYSSNNSFDYDKTGEALGMNLSLGWGINNKNIITTEVVAASAMDYENNYCGNRDNDPASGILGFNWYHYFNSSGSSWYTTLGFGRYVNTYDFTSRGLGFLIGGGYELSKHIQIGTYYYQGKTGSSSIKYTGRTLVFIITVVAY